MPRTVNVNYVTKEVKILLHDSETESVASATAIAAAASAQEAKDVVVDSLQDSLDAIDAKTEAEKSELDDYTDAKKTEISTFADDQMQSYADSAAASAQAADTTATALTTFLETKETLTAPAVDATLSVTGAAADAKVAGDSIRGLNADVVDNNSFDRLKHLTRTSRTLAGVTFTWHTDGSCTVTGTATGTGFTNLFNSSSSFPAGFKKGERYILIHESEKVYVEMFKYVNGTLGSSFLAVNTNSSFTIPDDASGVLIRIAVRAGNTVNETVNPVCLNIDSIYMLYRKALLNFGTSNAAYLGSSDADTMRENSIVFVSESALGEASVVNTPYAPGLLVTIGGGYYSVMSSNTVLQFMFPWNWKNGIMVRTKRSGTWSDWRDISLNDALVLSRGSDLNDLVDTANYLLAENYEYENSPVPNGAFFLEVNKIVVNRAENSNDIIQIAYGWGSSTKIYKRTKVMDNEWTPWVLIGGGGGGDVYNITQEITQVSNTNTYNATISPAITTDTNGWLQPVDTETESETGKTDMTSAIMGMLNSTGYCHLAEGIYYVSGNVDMPEGSTLEGCGNNTIIRLLSSVTAGYCVRVGRRNTVKNIRFSGGYNEADVSTTDIGGRNGIIFIANADGTESSQPVVTPCMISQCFFENFSGSAIYGHNSGGSIHQSMIVNQCFINVCKAGINLDYYTEYHKFTNIITRKCYYACINNGGNNVFTGCTFHGTIGFLMDNSSETKRNNAHGSVIGCTFNHIDNWNHPEDLGMGEAIKIIGPSSSGFIFTGCQIWYGSINVNNASGISFTNCLIGGNTPVINVSNNAIVFFANCVFRQTPALNVLPTTHFDNCYLSSNGSIISN